MPLQLWSWTLTAISIVILLLIGNRHRWAWPIALAGQGIWVLYAVSTDQLGFLGSAAIYMLVYIRNWRRDIRQADVARTPATGCTCNKDTPVGA